MHMYMCFHIHLCGECTIKSEVHSHIAHPLVYLATLIEYMCMREHTHIFSHYAHLLRFVWFFFLFVRDRVYCQREAKTLHVFIEYVYTFDNKIENVIFDSFYKIHLYLAINAGSHIKSPGLIIPFFFWFLLNSLGHTVYYIRGCSVLIQIIEHVLNFVRYLIKMLSKLYKRRKRYIFFSGKVIQIPVSR